MVATVFSITKIGYLLYIKGMIAEVTRINSLSMNVFVHDDQYSSDYSKRILEEQEAYVIVGDIIEIIIHPIKQNTILGRIRGRPVPNRFVDIYRQSEQPPSPNITNADSVRMWNSYVYLERATIDRHRESNNTKTNWLKEGF